MKKFEFTPDKKRENLNEAQKETLIAMGFESIEELKDFLEISEKELKNTLESSPKYAEIKERMEYFKEGLRQIKEMGNIPS